MQEGEASLDKIQTFLSSFREYQDTMEGLRPFKRPMLLWSTVSLIYVFGGLQLKVESPSLWGFEIVGMTYTKLTVFLFLTTLYYTVRWLWNRHLRLRTYKRDGFMNMLRQYGKPRRQAKEERSLTYDYLKGYTVEIGAGPLGKEINAIEEVRSSRGSIHDLFDLRFSARAVSYIEHNVIPYHLPRLIAGAALFALALRFLGCV